MQIQVFQDAARQKSFIEGQPVISLTGERELYVLLSGKVDVYDSGARLQDTIGPGRYFNARGLFFGDESITYIAHTDVLVQALFLQELSALLRANPTIAIEMLQEAYATRQELEELDAARENARNRARLQAKVQAMKTASAESEAPPVPEPKQDHMEQKPAVRPESEKAKQKKQAPADDKRIQTIVLGESIPDLKKEKETLQVKNWTPAKAVTAEPLPAPSFFLPGHHRYNMVRHPEYAAYVFAKQVQCPCCGAEFEGHKVFQSKLISITQPRYDLRQFYKDYEPAWYDLIACPSCYFSTFINLFLEPKNFSKSIADKKLPALRDELQLDFEGERTMEFVFATHYLALQCADSFLGERKISAKLWGNISWLYEDVGEWELERQAAKHAAEANERLYLEGKLTPSQEQAVAMTVAGFLYRAGETAEIRHWLFETKKQKTGKRIYTDLADDLLQALRDADA